VRENDKIALVDKGIDSLFAFRTPSLRNLRFTAPYMHNGTILSLQEVLEFYQDLSNGVERNPNVSAITYDPLIKKIDLKVKDMAVIISFLNTLNDDSFDKEIPSDVPSGLMVGGDIH